MMWLEGVLVVSLPLEKPKMTLRARILTCPITNCKVSMQLRFFQYVDRDFSLDRSIGIDHEIPSNSAGKRDPDIC